MGLGPLPCRLTVQVGKEFIHAVQVPRELPQASGAVRAGDGDLALADVGHGTLGVGAQGLVMQMHVEERPEGLLGESEMVQSFGAFAFEVVGHQESG